MLVWLLGLLARREKESIILPNLNAPRLACLFVFVTFFPSSIIFRLFSVVGRRRRKIYKKFL